MLKDLVMKNLEFFKKRTFVVGIVLVLNLSMDLHGGIQMIYLDRKRWYMVLMSKYRKQTKKKSFFKDIEKNQNNLGKSR